MVYFLKQWFYSLHVVLSLSFPNIATAIYWKFMADRASKISIFLFKMGKNGTNWLFCGSIYNF